jgi:hypothetical protein
LSHPHIVPIYEFGEHDGAHFLAMRFMEGGTLQMRAHRAMEPVEVARLVATITDALQYAHGHGVLHRDLKPGNILIDKDGRPYVADFGLARVSAEDSDLTVSNAVLGTAPYVAPEVAARGASAATTASDIYGLGTILYELLSGRAPFTGATIAEVLRRVQETEPQSLSQVFSESESNLKETLRPADEAPFEKRERSGRTRSVRVPRDLETICLKCLNKEPPKRYSTAQALADDLTRFLRGEPVLARPTGPTERAWRWCRRKPIVAGLMVALFLALTAGLAGVLWQWRRAERNATNEARARQFAEAESYTADMNLVLQAWEEGNLRRSQELLWKHVPGPGEQDLRGFEWRYLWKLCQDESRLTITNPPRDQIWSVEAVGKSNLVLARGERGVRLLAVDTGHEVDRFMEADPNREISASACSPAATNVVATGDSKGNVALWDLKSKAVLCSFQAHTKEVLALAFSADGRFMASTDAGDVGGGTLKLWNIPSVGGIPSTALWTKRLEHFCPALLFSPDGKMLVSAGKEENEGRLAVWDVNSGHEFVPFPKQHVGYVLCLAFSPDGEYLASSGLQPTIFIWDFAARHVATSLTGHIGAVSSIGFFSDGNRLVSGGQDNTIRIWDVAAQSRIKLLRGHRTSVQSVALSGDERSICSASGDEIRVWNTVSHVVRHKRLRRIRAG